VAKVDYADAFEIARSPNDLRTPEQWARAGMEDGSPSLPVGRLAHRWLLGFRLGPSPSPDHVFGWPIASSTPEQLHLRVEGSLMTGHMVWRLLPDRLVWTTSLEFHNPAAAGVWAVLGNVHRSAVPGVLVKASRG
jgi:hypothetical protein